MWVATGDRPIAGEDARLRAIVANGEFDEFEAIHGVWTSAARLLGP